MTFLILFLIFLVLDQAVDDKINDFFVYIPLILMVLSFISNLIVNVLDDKVKDLEEEKDLETRKRIALNKRQKVLKRQKEKFGENK